MKVCLDVMVIDNNEQITTIIFLGDKVYVVSYLDFDNLQMLYQCPRYFCILQPGDSA